ncbi:hypothetical protein ACQ4PT_021329 [Festuca glaucescens]
MVATSDRRASVPYQQPAAARPGRLGVAAASRVAGMANFSQQSTFCSGGEFLAAGIRTYVCIPVISDLNASLEVTYIQFNPVNEKWVDVLSKLHVDDEWAEKQHMLKMTMANRVVWLEPETNMAEASSKNLSAPGAELCLLEIEGILASWAAMKKIEKHLLGAPGQRGRGSSGVVRAGDPGD